MNRLKEEKKGKKCWRDILPDLIMVYPSVPKPCCTPPQFAYSLQMHMAKTILRWKYFLQSLTIKKILSQ